jgi:glycosyltransferase involved in cell wall biosynthesis
MMIVRNEADRYLKDVLTQLKLISDKIIILDDNSTDNTPYLCNVMGADICINSQRQWDKNEVSLRSQLWEIVKRSVNNNDWILCLDADELFIDSHIPFIKYLFKNESNKVDSIGFKLHDMWDEEHYRDDELWQAHKHYWCMAIRYKDNIDYKWSNKTLHCGRFPLNSAKAMIPTEIPILHMGWSKIEDRIKKYAQYMYIDPEGKNGNLEQYKSILDKYPNLKKINN